MMRPAAARDPRGRHADPDRDALIRRLVADGLTTVEIVRRTKLSESGIYKALGRLGLKATRPTHPIDAESEERDETIRRMADEGCATGEIASALGIAEHSVRRAARRLELTLAHKHRSRESYREAAVRAWSRGTLDAVAAHIVANDTAEAVTLIEIGRSVEEVAQWLGWPPAVVVARVSQAMQAVMP